MMLDELKDGKSYLLGGKVHGAAFVSCGRVVFMELPSCRAIVSSCAVVSCSWSCLRVLPSCRRVPSYSWGCLRVVVCRRVVFMELPSCRAVVCRRVHGAAFGYS